VTAHALTHADLKNIVRYDRKTGRWFWRPSPAGSKPRRIIAYGNGRAVLATAPIGIGGLY
jgi:hypothetical protein